MINDFSTKLPLYPYQIEGANMLVENNRFCLFDSIGLGKSAQILAALNHLKLNNVLIIVPNSLKQQWVDESLKFTNLTTIIIDGNPEKRLKQWKSIGIRITNYEKLRCKDDFAFASSKIWDCIVLDEVTRIKNYNTKVTNAVNKLMATRKWVATGTPIENCVKDLYSIYKFVNPSVFGNWWNFKTNFIVSEQKIFGSREFEIVTGYKNLELLKEMIKSSSIRRTKAEVMKELPPVVEEIIWIELNPREKHYYKRLCQIVYEKLNLIKMTQQLQSILGELQLMRVLCNGEVCLKNSQTTNPEVADWLNEVGTTSTKIDTTFKLLKDLLEENNGKIIVFSEFLIPLKILRLKLTEELGENIAELHGEIKDKEKEIELFKEEKGPRIMLCQTRTGGVGLNLQMANIVVFMNRDYNPSVEEQAIGRVYRQGQTKTVFVYYILTPEEEKINEILRSKQEIINSVIVEDVKRRL